VFPLWLAELGRTVGANWLFVGLHRMVGANRIGRRLCQLRKVYPHHTRNLTKNQAPNFVLSHLTRNHSSRSENRMAKPTPSPQVPNQPPKLLDRLRIVIRLRNYSIRTEEAYVSWVERYIRFHKLRHPQEMGAPEIEAFLAYLAVEGNVAASTQNQALCALLFLYKHVLDKELPAKINVLWAKKPERLPTVLTRQEVWQIIDKLSGVHHLMATLLYGTGMRLMENIRLRVKDVDFGQNLILIRDAKGDKDRITMLPDSTREPLQKQLAWAKTLHDHDLAQGYGMVYLPDALERKYPNAATLPPYEQAARQAKKGAGNISSRRINTPSIRVVTSSAATITTKIVSKNR